MEVKVLALTRHMVHSLRPNKNPAMRLPLGPTATECNFVEILSR